MKTKKLQNKKENKEERKITPKNYAILALIFIVATIISLYLANVYTVYQESKLEIPVIGDTLSEITSEELEHYISENPATLLYICTASDQKCRSYEKDFKKLIDREELQEYIVYLNLKPEERESFTENFNNQYSKRLKLTTNYPAIVALDEGKVIHLLQAKENEKLTITKTQQFIDIHNIKGE